MRQVIFSSSLAPSEPLSWVNLLYDYGLKDGDWRFLSWYRTSLFHAVNEGDRRSSALRHSTLLGSSHCILSMAFACLKTGRLYMGRAPRVHMYGYLYYFLLYWNTISILRPNSWMKSRQKSEEFSSLLFTVTSTFYSFALRFIFLQTHSTSYIFIQTQTRPTFYVLLQFSYCTL